MKHFSTMFFVILALLLATSAGFGQMMVQDDFNYVAGTDLSANGWSKTSSTPAHRAMTIESPGLLYTGYIG